MLQTRPRPAVSAEGTSRPRGSRLPGFLKSSRVWMGVLGFVVVGAIWELAARLIVRNDLFLVPLSKVGVRFWELSRSGELFRHLYVSGLEFGAGFGLAALVGISLGVAIAINRRVRELLEPLLSALYATPIVALAPLAILWFGIGMASKVAIVFLVALFPIMVNTTVGIRATEARYVDVGRAYGASGFQIFRQILLPYASSYIVSGLRLGLGRGLVGIVVGEMFGSREGVGYLIIHSAQVFDSAGVFVGVIMLALLGTLATELLLAVERRMAPWRTFAVGK